MDSKEAFEVTKGIHKIFKSAGMDTDKSLSETEIMRKEAIKMGLDIDKVYFYIVSALTGMYIEAVKSNTVKELIGCLKLIENKMKERRNQSEDTNLYENPGH